MGAVDAIPSAQLVVICKVVVKNSNIFDGQAASASAQQAVASGINRFHKTTRESVILREAGVKSGDSLSIRSIEDIERRLRRLGLFASASARLVTNNDCVELHLITRDNFSIVAGASGSYLGGVGNIGFTTGEKNVNGSGNKLLLSMSRSSTGNFRGALSFSDLHFFNNDWRANYRIGRTNEGDFYGINLSDTFRSLSDKREWAVSADRVERNIKYYRDGTNVVAIPEDKASVAGRYVWRSGSSDQYLRRGVVMNLSESDYSPSIVTDINDVLSVAAPADNRKIYIGGLLARDSVSRFMKVQGLDTLNFVQDISLGSSAEVRLGVNFIDEDATANAESVSRVDPLLSLILRKTAAAGEHTLLNLAVAGSATFEEEGARPWSVTSTFKAFYSKFNNNTLALRMDYTTGEDGSGLPVQLTLGEDNGLRGYDVRQFQGRQRLRMNLETRYRPGWKLGVVDVGVIGFFDAGWVNSKGDSSSSVKRSVGAGLRLASNALLGARVIRIDLAVPLDPPATENSDPGLSLAVGQVFRF